MGEKSFLIFFAIALLAMFLVSINGGGIGNNASSTAASTTKMATFGTVGKAPTFSQGASSGSNNVSVSPSGVPVATRSNQEIQSELEDLYDEFWELQQKVDSYERRQPVSRFAGKVQLDRSAAENTNPDREYLTLTVNQGSGPINISSWYLESYVTEKKAGIPHGAKTYVGGGTINTTQPVVLDAGQRAYLITGESPVHVSFQENMCIGYLRETEKFYPNISNNCPAPRDLLKRSTIALDDDSCYEFIERQWGCNTIDDRNPEFDELSGTCQRFIEKYLNYNSCVNAFSWRTDFEKNNDWYIYFERDEELWRNKREIIRLMDEHDAVVAVVEYY